LFCVKTGTDSHKTLGERKKKRFVQLFSVASVLSVGPPIVPVKR
jgi:hypothetical protein